MNKYNVGDLLLIEKSGIGFGLLEGMKAEVLSNEEVINNDYQVEGLIERSESVFFVYIDDDIYKECECCGGDKREFSEGTVWAIKESEETIFKLV